MNNRVHRLDVRLSLERALTGNRLVEDGAKAEDVCPMIDGLRADLFRRHEADGPEYHTGHRRVGAGKRGPVRRACRYSRLLSQTEIQNLDALIAGDEHVFRF